MSVSDTIRVMNLSELTCFEDAIRVLIDRRRKILLDPKVVSKGVVGLIQPQRQKGTRKVLGYVRVNAEVKELKRDVLIVEVLEPEGFRGQKLEASAGYIYEPFGTPGRI